MNPTGRAFLLALAAIVGGTSAAAGSPLVVHAHGRDAVETACQRARIRRSEPMEVGRIRIVMPRGAHHVDVFAPLNDPPTWPADGCASESGPFGWQRLAGTRAHALDVAFPPGVALAVGAQQPLLVQTGTSSGRRGAHPARARLFLYPTNPEQVSAHAGSLFADDRGVFVPPGSSIAGGTCALTGTADFGRELTIVALAGHYHRRGRDFTVERVLADGSLGEVVYRHHGSGAPPLVRYPDDAPLVLAPGEALAWTCLYVNDGEETLIAGPGAADEHCSLLGFYYPTDVTPESITCLHADPESFCPDGDVCLGGPCADGLSSCDVAACPEGEPCDDGDACTADDTCIDGACVGGTSVDCDDGNPCTDDFCDPAAGCTNVPTDGACDDGDPCTVDDACSEGTCVGGAPVDCDDGNPCTDDLCDPAAGCTNVPTDATCDDGDPCTIADTCTDGVCQGAPCRTEATAVVDADVLVDSSRPAENFGALPLLSADARPLKRTFLRVTVQGVGPATVAAVTLRLQVADVANAESDSGGRLHVLASCDWDEATVTWSSQPAIDPAVLAEAGAVARGDSVAFDVTPAIAGDGTYCFALDTASSNGVDYVAREAGDAGPTLTVALASDCTCSPAP